MRSWTDTCTCSAHYWKGALHMWLECQECMEFLEACRSSFGTFETFVCRLLKWLEGIWLCALPVGISFWILVFGASWEGAVCTCGMQRSTYTKLELHSSGGCPQRANTVWRMQLMLPVATCYHTHYHPVRVLLGLCVQTPQVVWEYQLQAPALAVEISFWDS